MVDKGCELTDKQEMVFRPLGPGGSGVGLGDGAGEGLVVHEEVEFPALNGVLKLLHGRKDGKECSIKG